jgi:hypothetical protein
MMASEEVVESLARIGERRLIDDDEAHWTAIRLVGANAQ